MTTQTIRTIRVRVEDDIDEFCNAVGYIAHETGPLCEHLDGARVESVRCSVCDQEWDLRFSSSPHERCAYLYGNDERRYASPVTTIRTKAGEIMRIDWVDAYDADQTSTTRRN